MTHTLDVLTIGEAMMLLVADRPGPLEQAQAFYKRTAGAETNVAIGLARLGLKVAWASRLGTDSMGRYLLAAMTGEGIDCSHVVCDPSQRTGFQFKGRVTDGSDPPVEYHRKGSAASLRNGGARVMITEVDPICALQAAMEGYEVVTVEDVAARADIFVTATGNKDVLTVDHMRAMKNNAIVCNIGHFDSEIQIAGLRNFKWDEIKPQVHHVEFPDGKKIIVLSEGRLVNLGNATGHPSFVMSASFTNQTLAQIELWQNSGRYETKVYTLPKHLDEKVAMLHLGKLGAKLTKLSKDQADYIGVTPEGPFKPDHYRY